MLTQSLEIISNKQSSIKKVQRLSEQELHCLSLTSQGKTTKEIARMLDISIFTVNTYKRRIMVKLGCKTISQAVYRSIEKGLVK
jgi:two-component system response regulator NreC